MRARTAWVAGAAGAAIALYRKVRRAPEPLPEQDPRAEELRQKLEESRAVVEEQHEEAASAETPVDEADLGVEDRRAAVHERARAAADEMRRE
jgi:peptidoglycan hydrolase CwlO-like protein